MRAHYLLLTLFSLFCPVISFAEEPATYTISYIRQNLEELNNQRVRLENVVCFAETGRYTTSNDRTVVQDSIGGSWSGAEIYDQSERLIANRGDTITAVGIVRAGAGTFELDVSEEMEFPPMITGNAALPEPILVQCENASELMYVDCFIKMVNIDVMSEPDPYNNIAISDKTGSHILILPKLEEPPVVGHIYSWMKGLNDYHDGEVKIRPRDANDWQTLPSLGVQIDMPLVVHPGDPFYVKGMLHNPNVDLADVPVFFFLGIEDMFWFWPTFVSSSDGVDYMTMNVVKGTTEVIVIDELTWPDTGNSTMQGLKLYGAMLDEEMTGVLGDFADVTWEYGP